MLSVDLINLDPLRRRVNSLRTVAEEVVDGRPAVGVREDRPDDSLTVFFDKQTYLPARFTRRTRGEPNEPDLIITLTFRDYKTFGGQKIATTRILTREVGDRRNLSTIRIADFKVLDTVDAALFGRPN
jgi:hypothetical protein